MNPQKKTRLDHFHSERGVALNEPRRSPRVAEFAGNLVLYRWIWW